MRIFIKDFPRKLQLIISKMRMDGEITTETGWGDVYREGKPHERRLTYVDSDVVLEELTTAIEKRSVNNEYYRRPSTKKRLEGIYELIELIEALTYNEMK